MSRVPAFITAFFCCFAASAVTLQQLTIDQMAGAATAIVRARVTGSSASLTGSTIYTHYRLQVSETWKGAPGSEVMLPGGMAGGIRQSYPGVPQLQTGSEYILFLWTSPQTGITHVVGMSQGIFNLNAQADGSVQASRPKIGEGMLDAAGHSVQDHAVLMDLKAMKSRILLRAAAGVRQ